MTLAACGGSGSNAAIDAAGNSVQDAAGQDIGFAKPTAALQANMEAGSNVWTALGAANLACLNTPTGDVATTVAVTLDTTVRDFQSAGAAPGVVVTAFPGIALGSAFFTGTSDGSGEIAATIPVGTTRFGFEMTNTVDLDTLLLNQKVDPSTPVQTVPAQIQVISKQTATIIPELIGVTRTAGTGIVAGTLRDCDDHEVSNYVAIVSATEGTATPLPGAASYYFSSTVDLPEHHSQAPAATGDGMFVAIQLPVTASAFVQTWGYPTDADVTADHLTLISEFAVPVLADTVVTGSFEPIRQ